MVSFFTQKTHRRFLGYSWEMRVLCSGFQSNMSKVTPPRNVISTDLTPQTTCSLGISLPLPHFPAVMLGPWVPPHCSWTALTWLTQTKFGYWHLSLLRAYHLDSLWNSFFQTNLYLFHFFSPSKWKINKRRNKKVTRSSYFIQVFIFPCKEGFGKPHLGRAEHHSVTYISICSPTQGSASNLWF